MNLQEALALFLGAYLNNKTRSTYESSLAPLVTYLGPQRDVTKITPDRVQLYVNDLMSRDTQRIYSNSQQDGKLSPYTIRKDIKTIKLFFRRLTQLKVIEASPAAHLPLPSVDQAVQEDHMATDEEIELLTRAAFGNSFRYAVVLFLRDTGCRVGEVCRVQVGDIDLENQSVRILGKGNKKRTAWYGAECAEALRNWSVKRPKLLYHDFFFCNPRTPHQPYQSRSLSKMVARLAVKAGIDRPLHAHAIRHWRATNLLRNGINAPTAAKAIGDSLQVFIKHYAHTSTDEVAEAVQRTAYRSQSKSPPPNVIRLGDLG